MKNRLAVVALVVFGAAGCSALAADIVILTKEEKVQAQSIAEQRQQIQFKRGVAQNEFQEKMNRLAEEENKLNIDSARLCFEFKKAHKLEANKGYMLDEWNGRLVKQ